MPVDFDKLEALGKSRLDRLEEIGKAREEEYISTLPKRGVLGDLMYGLKVGAKDVLPQNIARAIRGGNVDPANQGFIDRLATGVIEENERDLENIVPSQATARGNEANRSAFEGAMSAPFSLGLGAAGLGAGIATGGIAGGAIGAGATTYAGMFRMAKDAFVDSVYKQVKDKVTPEQWAETYKAIEKDADLAGHWEAGPEAFANALEPLLLRLPVSKLLPKNAVARIIGNVTGKIGMVAATEVPTEILTEKKQSQLDAKYGLGEEKTWAEATKDVAGPAAVGAGLAAGAFSTANKLGDIYARHRAAWQEKQNRLRDAQGEQAPPVGQPQDPFDTPEGQAQAAEYDQAVQRSTARPQAEPFNVPMQEVPPEAVAQARETTRPQVAPFATPMLGEQDIAAARLRATQRPQEAPFNVPMQPVPDRPQMAREANQGVINAMGQMDALAELQPESGMFDAERQAEAERLEREALAQERAGLGRPQVEPFNIPMQGPVDEAGLAQGRAMRKAEGAQPFDVPMQEPQLPPMLARLEQIGREARERDQVEGPSSDQVGTKPGPSSDQVPTDNEKLLLTKQMLEDHIATYKSQGKQPKQEHLNKLAEVNAKLSGEEIATDDKIASDVVFGHPQYDTTQPEKYGNLVPIKTNDRVGVEKRLDKTQSLLDELNQKIGKAQAIAKKQLKATPKQIKESNAYLASATHTEDEVIRDSLRDETLPELNRLYKLLGKKTLEATPETVAAQNNVTFNGMQEFPPEMKRDPMFTWTDPETKSTFLTKTLEEVPEALKAKRDEFAGAKGKAARLKQKEEKPAPTVAKTATPEAAAQKPKGQDVIKALSDPNKTRGLTSDEKGRGYSVGALFSDNKEEYMAYYLPPSTGRVGINRQFNREGGEIHVYKVKNDGGSPLRNPLQKPDIVFPHSISGGIQAISSKNKPERQAEAAQKPKDGEAGKPGNKQVISKYEFTQEAGFTSDRMKEVTGKEIPSIAEFRNKFGDLTLKEQQQLLSNLSGEIDELKSIIKLNLDIRKDAYNSDKYIYTARIKQAKKALALKEIRLAKWKSVIESASSQITAREKTEQKPKQQGLVNVVGSDEEIKAQLLKIKGDFYRGLSPTQKDVIRRFERGIFDRDEALVVIRAYQANAENVKKDGEIKDAKVMARMEALYGGKTRDELEKEVARIDAEIASFQRAGKNEFVDGRRRTAAATSNEAARQLGQTKLQLSRYIKEKFGDKPQTKKQKAQAEYRDYVASLSDEDRAKAGKLVEDEPKSPLLAKRQIEKMLANLDRVAEAKARKGEKQTPKTVEEANGRDAEPQATGKTGTAYTPKNTKIEFEYAVADVDDVVKSHTTGLATNPNYPKEIQPRQRNRKAMIGQVEGMANQILPEKLGASPSVSAGAPIVGPDMVVESGNGRSIALEKAYEMGKADGYKAWLKANADQFGLSADDISAVKKPILVRVRKTDVDRVQFAKEANKDEVARMSPYEQAVSDAELLTGDDMALFMPSDDGSIVSAANQPFINRFLQKIGDNEAAGVLTADGKLTKQGADRILAAIFAKAYNDEALVTLQSEEVSPDVKNILNALTVAAGEFARSVHLENYEKVAITDFIVEAAKLIRESRSQGVSIRQVLDQQGLFEKTSPEAEVLAVFIDANIRSGKRMGEAFKNMASTIRNYLLDQKQSSLFGEKKTLTRQQAIEGGIEYVKTSGAESQPELFGGTAKEGGKGGEREGRRGAKTKDAGKPETKLAVAHHGTPHIWPPEPGFPHGRPRLDKIFAKETVGEGAWARGAGWYSAEATEVAQSYVRAGKHGRIDILVGGKPYVTTIPNVKKLLFDFKGDIDKAISSAQSSADKATYIDEANDYYDAIDELRRLKKQRKSVKVKDLGSLYKLDIPDDVIPKLLDLDKPLSGQSEYVKKALAETEFSIKDLSDGEIERILIEEYGYEPSDIDRWQNWLFEVTPQKPRGKASLSEVLDWVVNEVGKEPHVTGGNFYNSLAQKLNPTDWQQDGKIKASQWLAARGIPGNKYFDGFSRGKGEGSRNYVIWDQKVLDRIVLLERNGEKLDAMRAALRVDTDTTITPEKVQRRGIDVSTTKNVKRVVEVSGIVTAALRASGLTGHMDKIAVELKPVIDLRGKNVAKTVKDWSDQGRDISVILGATTLDRMKAVVEISLEQDLTKTERTAFHEAFHVAAAWVLPEAQYKQLMDFYKGNEETAADAFADYMVKRKGPMGPVRKTFSQLAQFFKKVGNVLRGRGFTTPEKIFGELAAGKYGNGDSAARGGQTQVAFSKKELKPVDVESAAFKKWFEKSKVVDEKGEPLKVYHGTDKEFNSFIGEGSRTGHPAGKLGFFFTESYGVADMFNRDLESAKPFQEFAKLPFANGANIIPVYLSIKNPKVLTAAEFKDYMVDNTSARSDTYGWMRTPEAWSKLKDEFISNGYDGVKILPDKNQYRGSGNEEYAMAQWVAFEPTQAKSALTNTGDFSPTDPDIRFSVGNGSNEKAKSEYGLKKQYKKGDRVKYKGDQYRASGFGVIESKWGGKSYIVKFDSGEKFLADIPMLAIAEKRKFKQITEKENMRRVDSVRDKIEQKHYVQNATPGVKYARVVWDSGNFIETNALDLVGFGDLKGAYGVHITGDTQYWADRLAYDYGRDDKASVVYIEAMPGDILVEDPQQAIPDEDGTFGDSSVLVTGRELLKNGVDFTTGEKLKGNADRFDDGTETKLSVAKAKEVAKNPFVTSQIDKARETLGPKLDEFMYWVVDKNHPIQQIQSKLGNITEDIDLFMRETQRPKIQAAKIQAIWEDHIKPLLEKLAKDKISIPDLEEYSHAKHVVSDNANLLLRKSNAKRYYDSGRKLLAKDEKLKLTEAVKARLNLKTIEDLNTPDQYYQAINELWKIGWSKVAKTKAAYDQFSTAPAGMTDADAAAILKKHAGNKEIENARLMMAALNDMRLEILHDSGLVADEEYNAWKSKYKFYVPLHREGFDDVMPTVGRGIQPGGRPVKTRMGSNRNVVNILAHTVAQLESAVTRAEKAKSMRTLYELMQANPDPDVWDVSEVKKSPTHDKFGNIRLYPDMLSVTDNEMRIMVDGVQHLITVNEDNPAAMRMLKTLKASDNMGGVFVNALSKVNRWLARINTSWSPEFVISNFPRDLQTAAMNIHDTGVKPKSLFNGAVRSWKAIWNVEHGTPKGTPDEAMYKRFKAAGGKIGWADVHGSVDNLGKKLAKELEVLDGKRPVRKTVQRWVKFVEDGNTAVENGIRLHVFTLAVNQGMTDRKAAQIASDITVDFTKKGAAGPAINSLYLFANAGIQGSYRIIRAGAKSAKVRKMMAGIVGIGFATAMINAFAGGDDDDGESYYSKIEDYIRERNMIIMLPGTNGKYVKIPLPWGYNFFYNVGDEAARVFTETNYSPLEGAGRLGSVLVNAFNPVQAGTLLQTIAPTILDPIAQVAENKNWFGGPLMPEGNPFEKVPTPDSQRYWKSARTPSKWVAQGLNALTGGSVVRKGAIDVSPETLDLLVDTAGGSMLRFFTDTASLPAKVVSEEEMNLFKVPFVRRVAGQKSEYSDSQAYFKNVTEVLTAKAELKEYQGTPYFKGLRENLKSEISLIPQAESIEKELRKLRKLRRMATDTGDQNRVKMLEKKITELYVKFNSLYNKKIGG